MAAPKKPTNPFYVALLIVGTVFATTACAYGVLMVLKQDPRRTIDSPLLTFLDQRGLYVLVIELVLLGLCTFAAIGSEEYWEKS